MSSDNRTSNRTEPIQNEEPGEFNVKCETCNRIIAMDLENKQKVDQLLDEHQEGTECNEATVSMVLPQEPRSE